MTTTVHRLEVLAPKGNSLLFICCKATLNKKNHTYTNLTGPKSSPRGTLPEGARENSAGKHSTRSGSRRQGKLDLAFRAPPPHSVEVTLPGLQNAFTLIISPMAHTCKSSIWGAEAGGLTVQGQSGFHNETMSQNQNKSYGTDYGWLLATTGRRLCPPSLGVSDDLLTCGMHLSLLPSPSPYYDELWASPM